MYNKNNIFAKILRKELPCEVVFEDEKVLFFKDIYPQAEVHILGIPKIEVVDFSDFIKSDKDIVNHFFIKAQEVIRDLCIKDSGYKIITNNGKGAGQEVPHFHIHILSGKKIS